MARDLINLAAEDGRDIITDSTSAGLEIKQSGTGSGFSVKSSSTGSGIEITPTLTGKGLMVKTISSAAAIGVSAASTGAALEIAHSGTGDGITISHTGSVGESGIKSSADTAGEFIGLDTSETYNTVEMTTANISYASMSVLKIVASAASQAFIEFVGAGLVSTGSICSLSAGSGAIRVRLVTPQGLQMGWIPVMSDPRVA